MTVPMHPFKDTIEALRAGGDTSPLLKRYEDFENGVGTYLKVARFPEPGNSDGFQIIYLRPSGSFLLLGYWRGYERSFASGRWLRSDETVALVGAGQTSTDAPPDHSGPFHRILAAEEHESTPVLVARSELAGWSLLGWAGTFMYLGVGTVVNPDGQWLPRTLEDVDNWIARTATPLTT